MAGFTFYNVNFPNDCYFENKHSLQPLLLYNYSLNIHDSLDLNYLSFKTRHQGADGAGGRAAEQGPETVICLAWEHHPTFNI